MKIEFIKKEFKHSNCDELNKELDEFLSDLSFKSEGLNDNFMDIVLDHANQKEKEWEELYDSPVDWLDSLLIKTQRDVLESIRDNLENIVYSEKPKRTPRLRGKALLDWFADDVKPLVLNGLTKRKDIADLFGISEKCVRDRVQSAYYCNWKEYVQDVENRRI